jgi:P27 family predicted phage terminase small subunit
LARPRGRKPLPTYLKVVTGTGRASRENVDEPKPDLARPSPPPELNDDAKMEWGRVIDELYKLGIVSNLDRGILAAYCQSYGIWVQATRAINEMAKKDAVTHGMLVTTTNGNFIQNPLLGIANKAKSDMAKYATDLGMTPSARSRVHAKEPEAKG